MDVNWTYCGYHFSICTNTESLYCTHETDTCKLYLNKKMKGNRKGLQI